MASRVKEEEKIERTIRNLLKLPENRRCINCNSLGPQYVCTTFLTFVCTNCSGVHREFTHRVKSVSMAKFTAEEVTALQAAGNERAREIYLKTWDPQRHSYPENSNLHRLRDFIKHVYVDRKYSGEKSADELPRLRLTDKDSSQERRKITPYYGGLQNLQVEMPRSSSKREHMSPIFYYDERSSPRYSKENSRYGGYRRSLTRIEVVDDRIKDDRLGIRRLSNGDSKAVIQLSRSQENLGKPSLAVEFNNKLTTGKNEPSQRVLEDVRTNKGLDTGGPDQNVVRINPVETKRDNVGSLIDLGISSEPSDAAAATQTQQTPSSNNDNWNAFETSSTKNTSTAPSANTLEALLFELSVPSTGADNNPADGPGNSHAPATVSRSTLTPDFTMGQTALPISIEASIAGSTENVSLQTSNASPPQLTYNKGGDIALKIINGQQLPSTQTQQKQTFDYPSADTGLNSQLMIPAAVPNFEWTSSPESNAQGYSSVSADKIVATDSKPPKGTTNGVGSQPPSSEKSSFGRKELPLDLFTVNYSQVHTSHPGWQTGTQRVMGQNMQYCPTPVAAIPTNPFDVDDEKSRFYSHSAPTSMPALTGLTQRYGYQPEAQYSGTYVGQQVYGSIPSLRSQGVQNFGGSSFPSPFGSFNNTPQQPSSRYSAPNTNPIAPSFRNNPFG
ncbi:unnamed protein product [Citrullus colocynthis]|uniref:Arf-GAP domain-containing protein n=1 Tax=Citrullus colocynthis TaxID=252529 RepID=A0ABP0YEA3_9ROSI